MKIVLFILCLALPLGLGAQEDDHRHEKRKPAAANAPDDADSHEEENAEPQEDAHDHEKEEASHGKKSSHISEKKKKKHPHEAAKHGDEKHGEEKEHEGHEEGEEEEHAEGEEHGEEGHEEGEEEEEFSSSVGPGNAVTAASPETGLQLSDEALKTLGVKTQPLPANNVFPKQAIVMFKNETGVYRLRDGWYKLIEGETEPQGNRVRFTPHKRQDLRPGDQIVVEGVPLLRVTELDAFSGGEAGHAH